MTPNIRIVFRPALARLLGFDEKHSILIRSFEPGESLADVLARLASEYPTIATRIYDISEKRVNSIAQITINGRLLPLAGDVEALLGDGDEILFFSAAGGG